MNADVQLEAIADAMRRRKWNTAIDLWSELNDSIAAGGSEPARPEWRVYLLQQAGGVR